jgi:DNA-binding beta-propeller fold protein YncE/cytochrome c553
MRTDLIQLLTAAMLAVPGHVGVTAGTSGSPAIAAGGSTCAGPTALAATRDGNLLFIACAGDSRVAIFDLAGNGVTRSIPLPASPSGLVLTKDGARLYVTCAAAASVIYQVDVGTGRILRQFPAGHTALAPVLSPDEQTLYVCNRFNDDVSFIGLRAGREFRRVKVQREPIAAALTPGGEHLLVANHLPAGRADGDVAAAAISVIDTSSGRVLKDIALPNGSGLLRDLRVSPDGEYACVTHVLARFHFVPRTVHLGWINENAISLIDLRSLTHLGTVVLDEVFRGAANPWAVAWSAEGDLLCVTHAGTHELSLINAPALLEKLNRLPARFGPPVPAHYERFAHYQMPRHGPARSRAEVPNDFGFLTGIRRRVSLEGLGPRAIAVVGRRAYVAHYFSDSLNVVELTAGHPAVTPIALGPHREQSFARQGEHWFNDATLCSQGWQSCASCHDDDARADGLNWDLLNDGAHNPKNTRSLLLAHQTPPVMSLRVRNDAATAVRAGLHHILFADAPPEVPAALDAYLQSLHPFPSPRRVNGHLSASAKRGQRLFFSARTGCADCHPPPLFTDLAAYDVGTAGDYDRQSDRFDTPTLVELWRTAPYLHHGSAATLREVLTTKNPNDQHGTTSHLTPREIDDLVEYLSSL